LYGASINRVPSGRLRIAKVSLRAACFEVGFALVRRTMQREVGWQEAAQEKSSSGRFYRLANYQARKTALEPTGDTDHPAGAGALLCID